MKLSNLSKALIVCSLASTSSLFSQNVTGSGTINYLPKFNGTSSVINSQILDNGSAVTIGGTAPVAGDFVTVQKANAGPVLFRVTNTNATGDGTSAITTSIGTYETRLATLCASYVASGIFQPRRGVLHSNTLGGFNIGTTSSTPLSLWTNNLERLVVSNTGNVGIGVSAPSKMLEVVSTGVNTQVAKFADNARYIGIGRDEVAAFDLSGNLANLYLGGGGKLTVLSNGNVGVGTTTPSKRFQVVGDAQIENLSFSTFGGSTWLDASNGLLLNYFSAKETLINTAWTLQTDQSTGNTTATQDGGTVTMGAKVHMANSLRLGWSGTGIDLNTNIEINQSNNNASAVKVKTWNASIKAFSTEMTDGSNSFLVNGDGKTQIFAGAKTNKYFAVVDRSTPSTPVESFVVYGDGGTVIGDNYLPTGYKLAVNGKVLATEVWIKLRNNWPDYVFNSNYNLTPLKEVEDYIKQNKHLSGFESADEYQKNGMSVNDILQKQQEKIEELTLYLIDMKKEMELLKNK